MHVANPAVMYSLPCTAAVYQQPQVPTPGYAPPIQALNIPAPFHGGGFSQGHGGRGNGGPTWHHTGHGERGLNPFRNAGQGAGTVFVPGGVVIPPYGPYLPAVAPVAAQCNFTPTPVKKFNNWNVCHSCSFDIEDNIPRQHAQLIGTEPRIARSTSTTTCRHTSTVGMTCVRKVFTRQCSLSIAQLDGKGRRRK